MSEPEGEGFIGPARSGVTPPWERSEPCICVDGVNDSDCPRGNAYDAERLAVFLEHVKMFETGVWKSKLTEDGWPEPEQEASSR